MNEYFQSIFHRRHDCIHNCDFPKISPQLLERGGRRRNPAPSFHRTQQNGIGEAVIGRHPGG